MERRRIRFSGRVQGVGFRATTVSIARDFGVTGWVRNAEDGSVILEVQGQPDEIDRFLGALRSEMGRLIAGEDVQVLPPAPDEAGFEIRR